MLRPGVDLYGGFAGNETERDQRDWNAHKTTIDGSVARNGATAHHVLVFSTSNLDGFVVTGGHASGEYAIDRGAGAGRIHMASPTIANCEFLGNQAELGAGGIAIGDGAPLFLECSFNMNSADSGGAVTLGNRSRPTFVHCSFVANSAKYTGGAIAGWSGGFPIIRSCVFLNNVAGDAEREGSGGAIAKGYENMTVENCVFIGNRASKMGGALATAGIYYWESDNYDGFADIKNCIFRGNDATEGGGALANFGAVVKIWNTIIWNNGAIEVVNQTEDCNLGSSCVHGTVTIHHSDVQGGYEGEANLDTDPLLVDPQNGDVRLRAESPCIDAGTAEGAPETDIRGVARPQGAGFDMGAYEYQPSDTGDVNADKSVDAVDVQLVINGALGLDTRAALDLDGNTQVDAIDVQMVINAALVV
ncbi:MAG: hypothetical protein HY706_01905 [Candidatus Hydrogenedentes bacterium]|nr:hypothetical protein [Candidatus Hydrogenedentota bacterium]